MFAACLSGRDFPTTSRSIPNLFSSFLSASLSLFAKRVGAHVAEDAAADGDDPSSLVNPCDQSL